MVAADSWESSDADSGADCSVIERLLELTGEDLTEKNETSDSESCRVAGGGLSARLVVPRLISGLGYEAAVLMGGESSFDRSVRVNACSPRTKQRGSYEHG